MNRKSISIAAALALAITVPATTALAQAPAATSVPKAAGPTVAASTVGIRSNSTTTAKPNSRADERNLGAGRNVALMVVGGAALVIGAVIGGAAGILIAVAGAAVGLYGLYYFVQ